MNHDPSALRGAELDAFIDRVIALARGDLDDDLDGEAPPPSDEAEQAALARARDVFASRALIPTDVDLLARVFHAWRWLGAPDLAWQALEAHEAHVLEALSPTEQALARNRLALLRLDHLPQGDSPAAHAAQRAHLLRQAAEALSSVPLHASHDLHADWHQLMHRARSAKDADVFARCAQAVHTQQQTMPARQSWRSHDAAKALLREATAEHWRGNAAQANALGHRAMATLTERAADQDVNEHDWLNLGRHMLRVAPELLEPVLTQARAALPEPHSPARLRDLAVQLARLQAFAHWQQGRQDAALRFAKQGLFLLSSDEDDAFGAQVMEWRMQAGQEAAAAELALEATWAERVPSTRTAVQMAMTQLASDTPHAGMWHLVLCAAAQTDNLPPDVLSTLGHDSSEAALPALLTKAKASLPEHPLPHVIEGTERLHQNQHAQALPLLEHALQMPQLCNAEVAQNLWLTRLHVMGQAGLNLPFVETGSGSWSYSVGVMLSDPAELLAQAGLTPQAIERFDTGAIRALSVRYYERAMLYFEGFFATGEGNRRDGNIHDYAMNCNNLAIQYRWAQKRPEDALRIHHKGIAASPFAEHYDGVMTCLWELDRYEEFLRAADDLWQFSMENGYGRHDPTDYFGNVAWALHHLNRHAEIEIWIDRLHQWQRDMDPDWLESEQGNLLACEASLQAFLANTQSPDPVARLQVLKPLLVELDELWGLNRVGHGLFNAGHVADALATHELVVQLHNAEEHPSEVLSTAQEGIALCQETLTPPKKPFWRRWF